MKIIFDYKDIFDFYVMGVYVQYLFEVYIDCVES